MSSDLIFKKVNQKVAQNQKFINISKTIEKYATENSLPVFMIQKPLVGDDDDYFYEFKNAIVLLIPGHKLLFLNLADGEEEQFEDFVDDFTNDLNSLSNKYKHKKVIGNKRKWMDLIVHLNVDDFDIIEKYSLKGTDKRKSELLISLITGSINDASRVDSDEPANVLEAIKKRIILFDADQTRFIYNDEDKHQLTIQGLAGTGKTELLLHKLVDLYINEPESRIVFTCFNTILANDMSRRIPDFFNFMKADQQIEWNERLWAMRSWGAQANPDSGIYSYICNKYNLPFSRYVPGVNFNTLCGKLLRDLDQLEDFEPCFDYILIDEGQDFDDLFFALCEKVASKQVIIASDIFQNIFEKNSKITHNPDFTLNKVYRTDPKNFLFAQMIGFGVMERPVINWLDDKTWETCGYIISKNKDGDKYTFTRNPLNRFGDLANKHVNPLSIFVEKSDDLIDKTLKIIQNIIDDNVEVSPDDIGIVFLSNNKIMYNTVDRLSIKILEKFDWETQKGYEQKKKSKGKVFISNKNNIKGLEFPFVICIANDEIQSNASVRNSLYMALTRSFITSYLVLDDINSTLIDKYLPMYNQIIKTGSATIDKPNDSEIMTDDDRSLLQNEKLTNSQLIEHILNEHEITDTNIIQGMKILLANKKLDNLEIRNFIEQALSNFKD